MRLFGFSARDRRCAAPMVALMLALGLAEPAAAQPATTTIYYRDDRIAVDNEPGSRFAAIGMMAVTDPTRRGSVLRATAFIISQCHALTARHTLIPYLARGRQGSITFRPGGGAPVAARVAAVGQEPGYGADWALLELDACLGRRIRPLSLDLRPPARVVALREELFMAGFPLDRARLTPVMDPSCRGQGLHADDFTLAHDCTGGSGMSGAPLMRRGPGGEAVVVAIHSAAPFLALETDGVVPSFHPLKLSKAVPVAPLAQTLQAQRLIGLRTSGYATPEEVLQVPPDVTMDRFAEQIVALAQRQDLMARLYLCVSIVNRSAGTPEPANPNCQALAPFFEARAPLVRRNPLLAYYVGVLYFYGLTGQAPDWQTAKDLLLIARSGGVPQAAVLIGVLAEAGSPTVAPEPQTALREFAFAAKAGVVEGVFQAAELYHRTGVIERAVQGYQEAARQGHPDAGAALAEMQRDLADGRLDTPPSATRLPRLP